MTYKLLVQKLYLANKDFITAEVLRQYCVILNMSYDAAVSYLTNNKYILRILKGIFYRLSLEERRFNTLDITYIQALRKALKLKEVNNWYFGLETAKKFNNLTHEFFTIDYVINDSLFRQNPVQIFGQKIKFIKISRKLFGFGTKTHNKIKYSSIEKTILDMIYLSRYNGLTDTQIINRIADLMDHASKKKLMQFAKKYNKEVMKFITIKVGFIEIFDF